MAATAISAASSSAATSTTATASTTDSTQKIVLMGPLLTPSEKALFITGRIAALAILVIGTLAICDLFPGVQGAMTVSITLIACGVAGSLIQISLRKKLQLHLAQIIIPAIAYTALGILGMTGVLNASAVASYSLIATAGFGYLASMINRRQDRRMLVILTVALALLAANALAITGVINGEAGRIALGAANVLGTAAFVAGLYHKLPKEKQKYLLLHLIPAAILGGLGIYGVISPFYLAAGALIADRGITHLEYAMAGPLQVKIKVDPETASQQQS